MKEDKLIELLDLMANGISQLMENECGNSGTNWLQDYEILKEEIFTPK